MKNDHDVAVFDLVKRTLSTMLAEAQRDGVCLDCTLKDLATQVSLNILVGEAITLERAGLTSKMVTSFVVSLRENIMLMIEGMENGQVSQTIVMMSEDGQIVSKPIDAPNN